MTPDQLAAAVTDIVAALGAEGRFTVETMPEVRIERPKSREHGDYATNIALALAKQAGLPPRDLAGMLAVEDQGIGDHTDVTQCRKP